MTMRRCKAFRPFVLRLPRRLFASSAYKISVCWPNVDEKCPGERLPGTLWRSKSIQNARNPMKSTVSVLKALWSSVDSINQVGGTAQGSERLPGAIRGRESEQGRGAPSNMEQMTSKGNASREENRSPGGVQGSAQAEPGQNHQGPGRSRPVQGVPRRAPGRNQAEPGSRPPLPRPFPGRSQEAKPTSQAIPRRFPGTDSHLPGVSQAQA